LRSSLIEEVLAQMITAQPATRFSPGFIKGGGAAFEHRAKRQLPEFRESMKIGSSTMSGKPRSDGLHRKTVAPAIFREAA
jgi:hypothetical protein